MQFDHHNNQLIDYNNVWLCDVSNTDAAAEVKRKKGRGDQEQDSLLSLRSRRR